MTVLWRTNGRGSGSRCDAKCHYATQETCHCICGGRYHGVGRVEGGLRHAIEESGDAVIAEAKRQANAAGIDVKYHTVNELFFEQQELFV